MLFGEAEGVRIQQRQKQTLLTLHEYLLQALLPSPASSLARMPHYSKAKTITMGVRVQNLLRSKMTNTRPL